jgi:hypothetical protein
MYMLNRSSLRVLGQHAENEASQPTARGVPIAHRRTRLDAVARREVQDLLENIVQFWHGRDHSGDRRHSRLHPLRGTEHSSGGRSFGHPIRRRHQVRTEWSGTMGFGAGVTDNCTPRRACIPCSREAAARSAPRRWSDGTTGAAIATPNLRTVRLTTDMRPSCGRGTDRSPALSSSANDQQRRGRGP